MLVPSVLTVLLTASFTRRVPLCSKNWDKVGCSAQQIKLLCYFAEKGSFFTTEMNQQAIICVESPDNAENR